MRSQALRQAIPRAGSTAKELSAFQNGVLPVSWTPRLGVSFSVTQAPRDLDVHENQLRKRVKLFSADPAQAFPGHAQMKPEQLEIEKLRREVAKLKLLAPRALKQCSSNVPAAIWRQDDLLSRRQTAVLTFRRRPMTSMRPS